jgi:hypothetical protein
MINIVVFSLTMKKYMLTIPVQYYFTSVTNNFTVSASAELVFTGAWYWYGIVYMDHNCFQRGFDDPRQIKIQLEALACEEIFSRAGKKIHLIWSFMHEDENMLCPFIERKLAVNSMKKLCQIHVEPVDEILEMARSYVITAHLSPKDAFMLRVQCIVALAIF